MNEAQAQFIVLAYLTDKLKRIPTADEMSVFLLGYAIGTGRESLSETE